MAVEFHDVPEDRASADLDHRLRLGRAFFGDAGAVAAREYYDFHGGCGFAGVYLGAGCAELRWEFVYLRNQPTLAAAKTCARISSGRTRLALLGSKGLDGSQMQDGVALERGGEREMLTALHGGAGNRGAVDRFEPLDGELALRGGEIETHLSGEMRTEVADGRSRSPDNAL